MVDKTSPHPVTHHKHENIHVHDNYERRTQVTENLNTGRRLAVSRIANLIWLLFYNPSMRKVHTIESAHERVQE